LTLKIWEEYILFPLALQCVLTYQTYWGHVFVNLYSISILALHILDLALGIIQFLRCFASQPSIIWSDGLLQFIYKIIKNDLRHMIMIGRSLTVTASCFNSKKSFSTHTGSSKHSEIITLNLGPRLHVVQRSCCFTQ
jgi:hypothetical protein